jgi:thiaminase
MLLLVDFFFVHIQVHRGIQTEITCLLSEEKKLFNKIIKDEHLEEVTSFFTENTLTDDIRPVYVDHLTQTVESGNLLNETGTQVMSCVFDMHVHVFTDNIISESERNNCGVTESYTQTIITYI